MRATYSNSAGASVPQESCSPEGTTAGVRDDDFRVSIALATYNGEKFLPEQLESYVRQTTPPAELVVTDDCSSDRTRSIIREFASSAPFPVRLHVNGRRLGFRDNFLKAASLCSSRFVAYSDQDDVWLPSKLARCTRALQSDGAALAIHGAFVVDESLNIKYRMDQGFSEDDVRGPLTVQPLPGMGFGFSMVFERRLLQLVKAAQRPRQPDEPECVVSHDLWTYFLASVFGTISQVAEPLVLYRQHGGNAYGFADLPASYKVLQYLQVPLRQYNERLRFARECSGILNAVSSELGSTDRLLAENGGHFYGRLASNLENRIALYESASVRGRASAYLKMRREGAYQTTLGRAARVRDLVNGVLGLRLTTRTGS